MERSEKASLFVSDASENVRAASVNLIANLYQPRFNSSSNKFTDLFVLFAFFFDLRT